jgi:hypothetical protein
VAQFRRDLGLLFLYLNREGTLVSICSVRIFHLFVFLKERNLNMAVVEAFVVSDTAFKGMTQQ